MQQRSSDLDGKTLATRPGSIPMVSVIIPHFNDFDGLALCLDKLRSQTWPEQHREIIIADNNSVGGVPAVQAIARDALVVAAPEQGAGPARNAAVAHARGSILAFIDSDCVPEEAWISEGVAALQCYDYVGGQVRISVPDPRHPTPAEAVEMAFSFDFQKHVEHDRFAGTGNLFMPKALFVAVGGFRNGVSEDVEWCWRANALGYRLGYAELALVRHPARREWAALTRRWDRVIAETLALRRSQPHWAAKWLLYCVLVAISPLPHATRVLRSNALKGARAKVAGLTGLFGIRTYRAYRGVCVLCQLSRSPGGISAQGEAKRMGSVGTRI